MATRNICMEVRLGAGDAKFSEFNSSFGFVWESEDRRRRIAWRLLVNDVLTAAAGVLAPLVAGGTGAVAAGVAQAAGEEFYRKATVILDRVRGRLTGRLEPVDDVRAALQAALDAGELKEAELTELLVLSRPVGGATQHGGRVVVGGIVAGDGAITLVGTNNVGDLRGGNTGR